MTLEEQLEKNKRDKEETGKEYWCKKYLGIQPEILLGIVCAVGWSGTAIAEMLGY